MNPISTGEAINRKARDLPCMYCGANPGQGCVTKSGNRAGYAHTARWYEARDVVFSDMPLKKAVERTLALRGL